MYQLVCERISALSSTERIPAHRTILARCWDSAPMGLSQPHCHALPAQPHQLLPRSAAASAALTIVDVSSSETAACYCPHWGPRTRSFGLLADRHHGLPGGLGSSAFLAEASWAQIWCFKPIIAESCDLVFLTLCHNVCYILFFSPSFLFSQAPQGWILDGLFA